MVGFPPPSAWGRRLVKLGHRMKRSFRLSLTGPPSIEESILPLCNHFDAFLGQNGVHTRHVLLEGAKWNGAARAQRSSMLNHRLICLAILVGGQKDGVHRFEETSPIGKAEQPRIRTDKFNISRRDCAAIWDA